jgi:hypothetical protein
MKLDGFSPPNDTTHWEQGQEKSRMLRLDEELDPTVEKNI